MYTHTVPGSLPLIHTAKKKIMNHSHPIHPYTDDWCCDQYWWQNQGVWKSSQNQELATFEVEMPKKASSVATPNKCKPL